MEQVSCDELPSLLKCAASEKVAGFDSVACGITGPQGETTAGKVRCQLFCVVLLILYTDL